MYLQRDFLKQSLAATRWEEKMTGQNPRSQRLPMMGKGVYHWEHCQETEMPRVRGNKERQWAELRQWDWCQQGQGRTAATQEWAGKTGPLPLEARWAGGGVVLQAVSVDCWMPGVDPQTLGGHDRESYNDWETVREHPRTPARCSHYVSHCCSYYIKHCVIVWVTGTML